MVGGLTLLSVLAITMSLRPRRNPITERLLSHAQFSELAEEELQRPFWDRAVLPFLRSLLGLLGRLSPRGNVEAQRRLLLLAGNPGNLSVVDFLGVKLLLAGLFFGLALMSVANTPELSLQSLLILVAAPALGYYLPSFWIKRRIKARQHQIERALPDVLDMLTICVESGLGLDAAMLRVGEQWDNVLTREMGRAVREMRMGISRAEALRHMVQRTEAADLGAFVAVVVQAEQLGVSIANVLRTQSDQMRVIRWQRAEERARGAPFKMVFAMVFLIFPSLFIVILGPSIPRFQEFLQGMMR
ncbi:MAG: type II secretion system F family protein [Anaerolineae bacterium]|nr:type II secretion system F family protein [Anaerolineae bacterium]